MQLRDKFNPFYQRDTIKVLTEDQIRLGLDAVGIDVQDATAHQMELGIKPDKDKKYTRCTYKSISEQDPQYGLMTKDRSSVKTYLAASVLNPTAEGVTGLNDEADEALFEAKILDLEAKEADIIHELYMTHFVVADPNADKNALQPDAKTPQTKKEGQNKDMPERNRLSVASKIGGQLTRNPAGSRTLNDSIVIRREDSALSGLDETEQSIRKGQHGRRPTDI